MEVDIVSGRQAKAGRVAPRVDVQLTTRGDVPIGSATYAVDKIRAVVERVVRPVLSARVRLTLAPDPAVERPAMAQAVLDLDGHLLRAHTAAPTMREAIDRMEDRLVDQLDRLVPDWESTRGAMPQPGQWRHSSVPAHRPEHYPRPPAERRVVRHKAFSLPRTTVDEAAFDMEMLDYDFYLFTDLDNGQDSVVYRDPRAGEPDADPAMPPYRLAQLTPVPQQRTPERPSAVAFSRSPVPAPRLTVPEAADRLDLTGLPFVFFENVETGRGNLLYHRYNGHYGLITPVE
jgi:hypothetical protein